MKTECLFNKKKKYKHIQMFNFEKKKLHVQQCFDFMPCLFSLSLFGQITENEVGPLMLKLALLLIKFTKSGIVHFWFKKNLLKAL